MIDRILIAGMPASGKSTFIAALRHVLVAQEVGCSLELTELADEETHLNELERHWLEGKMVQRTKTATETWVEFRVRDRESGDSASLALPDLRGEAFEQPATAGSCSVELLGELESADAIMLFTNANRSDDNIMISDLGDMFEDTGPQDTQPITDFDPSRMPEEPKIVELLQFANRKPRFGKQRKLVLIISAWDMVSPSLNDDPDLWLRTHRPMLAQFLEHNPDLWRVRIYGVSAQGGVLPAAREELMAHRIQSQRIRVAGNGAGPHDITAPLRWLIASDASEDR
jgi:Double-GTPase 1